MIAIVLHDIQRKAGSLNRGSLPLGFLFALIGSEKESNDLCAGAAIVRPEQAITNAVCDAVLHRPCHSVCIVAIGKNIAELCLAIDQLTNGTEQESHALGTGAGGVRTEFAIARSCGDTVLHRPRNCLSIIAVRRNIREAAHALGFGRTGSAPQEGDDLRTGARLVRPKEAVADAAGDALFLRPLHSLIVIGTGGHIAERACLNFLSKGSIDFDLAGRHGKGIFAVALVGQLQFLTILVGNGEVIQFETIVRLDGDCHGITTLGVAAVCCHCAVPDVLAHLDGVSRVAIVATGAFPNQSIDSVLNGFCHGIYLALLGNVLVTDNSLDSGFHAREIHVVIFVQCICLGNGCVNLSVAEAMEKIRSSILIFSYQLRYIGVGKNSMGKRVDAVKPELERYAGLVQQIKEKSKERKNLLAEKKETPFYQIPKLHDLTRRITELTEEIEELKTEKEIILSTLDCTDDAGISVVKKEIATLESALQKLSEQEEKYSAELDEALKQYAEMKEQAAGMDAAELMDARLAVREEKERSAVDKVKSAYGEKYDSMLMYDSKRDVSNLLHEEAELRSVREFMRRKQQQQAQQKQTKKKNRDSWER